MTTASGLPVSVAPLPPGSFVTEAQLMQTSGCTRAQRGDPACPTFPQGTRMFGQMVIPRDIAEIWLGKFARFLANVPEMAAQRNAAAVARHENAMREREAQEQAGYAHGREMQAMWEQSSADRARIEAENAERAAGHEAIVIDAHGKRVY